MARLSPKYFGLETPLGLCWWWCLPPSGFVSGAGRTLLIVVSSSRSAPCEYSLLVSCKQSTAQMKLFHRMRLMIIIIKIIMCAFIWHCINSPQMLVLALLLLLLVPSRSPTPYDGWRVWGSAIAPQWAWAELGRQTDFCAIHSPKSANL